MRSEKWTPQNKRVGGYEGAGGQKYLPGRRRRGKVQGRIVKGVRERVDDWSAGVWQSVLHGYPMVPVSHFVVYLYVAD